MIPKAPEKSGAFFINTSMKKPEPVGWLTNPKTQLAQRGVLMPSRAKRPCRQCLKTDCQCRRTENRGTSTQRGYDARHRRDRLRHMSNEPCCRSCAAKGLAVPGTILDHVIPVRQGTAGWQQRLRDPNNWQTLCTTCHNIKTAKGL